MKNYKISWIYTVIYIGLLLIISDGCKNEKVGQLPTVITMPGDYLTQTSIDCGGEITSDGGTPISSRGLCWSNSQNPTIEDNLTTEGTGIGIFRSIASGLNPNTEYYIRAYATNTAGTGYGDTISFTTLQFVTDIDGNEYNSVVIGTQEWLSENLKVTRYRNGDLIGTTNPFTLDISGESTPKYQWAKDGSENEVITYGRLYTWYAVMDSRCICSDGWHIPSDTEWIALIDYLGGEMVAGGKLKETGTVHWISPNYGATNESGFTALPGGYRDYSGSFRDDKYQGYWWSSSVYNSLSAWGLGLDYSIINAYWGYYEKVDGFYVRCIRD
jgi:uncharacterized protein (TIGR02145 family)